MYSYGPFLLEIVLTAAFLSQNILIAALLHCYIAYLRLTHPQVLN